MAQLRLKQLDSVLTGSLKVSGSLDVTGSLSASSLDVAGNARFDEYIYHREDVDTFIRLQPDEINIEAGGENMIFIVEGGGGDQADKVTINNLLADIDFQVKGTDWENLLRTDAVEGRVGIGLGTGELPNYKLDVKGTIHSSTGNISGSATSTGSFGSLVIADKVQGNATFGGNISGSSTSTGSFGSIKTSGDINAAGRIAHDGDSDTRILFTDDDINIQAGGMNMIDFTEDTVSEITINESGADLDFRVESDDDTKAIYVNAGQNSIQLGSAATTHVTASGNISGSSTSTGSFGRVDTTGDIYASGRIYEAGSSVIDHATAMAIVFGG